MPTLAERIAELVSTTNLSTAEIAAEVGCSDAYVRAVKGRRKMAVPIHVYRARMLDRCIRNQRKVIRNLEAVRARRIRKGVPFTRIAFLLFQAWEKMADLKTRRAANPTPRSYCKPRRPELDQTTQP